MTVHSYAKFRPEQLQFIRDEYDPPKESCLFFGFEFEFECKNKSAHMMKHHNHARKVTKNYDYVWFTRDGSLYNGMEMKTMPMTMQAVRNTNYDFSEIFGYLRDSGYELAEHGVSGEGGAFHVHVNRDYFTDDEHIKRFESSILEEAEGMIAGNLAVRSTYCKTEPHELYNSELGNQYTRDKYVWVNPTRRTVELRMFSNMFLKQWGTKWAMYSTMLFIENKIQETRKAQ